MRVAIIDLGTNSVRFDVHQIGPKNRVRELHREKLMVRLGQGVFTSGRLNPEAIRRTLHAFKSFQKTSAELGVDRIVAFGTAALREVTDGTRFIARVKSETGIEMQVISGAEEARLIALGILAREKAVKGRFGLIDIGGGSTEISICRGKQQLFGHSFPLGTARLQQVFLRSSPPRAAKGITEDPVESLRRHIRTLVLTKALAEGWPKVDKLIGSSGTVRALVKMCAKKNGKTRKTAKILDRGDLKKLVKRMSTMTTTELLALPGMEGKRVDMILAGAILLEECMNVTGAKKAIATEFSLRDGILEEQKQLVRERHLSPLSIHLKEIREKAARIHRDMTHTDQVARLGDEIFDAMKKIHGLSIEWRARLHAAALLHDAGEVISPTAHDEHAYYFVRHTDLPAMEKWEREIIARLCRYHKAGKPQVSGNRERKEGFLRCLAMLRLADAMDRSHKAQIQVLSARATRTQIIIKIRAKKAPDLELLRVDQKKALFETVFKKELKIV